MGDHMKKRTTGLAIAAAAGITLLSASPAIAAPYENCTAAAAEGVFNIPNTDPRYGTHLDSDLDGIGCENSDYAIATPPVVVQPAPPVAEQPVPVAPVEAQVGQMPVGGAETGVAQPVGSNAGALALGGGLVLAAAVGGAFVVRRHNA